MTLEQLVIICFTFVGVILSILVIADATTKVLTKRRRTTTDAPKVLKKPTVILCGRKKKRSKYIDILEENGWNVEEHSAIGDSNLYFYNRIGQYIIVWFWDPDICVNHYDIQVDVDYETPEDLLFKVEQHWNRQKSYLLQQERKKEQKHS